VTVSPTKRPHHEEWDSLALSGRQEHVRALREEIDVGNEPGSNQADDAQPCLPGVDIGLLAVITWAEDGPGYDV